VENGSASASHGCPRSNGSERIGLTDPNVLALAAISGLNDEEIPLNNEEFVAIDCSRRYAVERVTSVAIEQTAIPNGPASGEFRDQFTTVNHFAVESAVLFEDVMTALEFISVTPFTCECSLRGWLQGCARRHKTEREREHSFHA
jgi:hypothetical protein